MLLKDLTLVGWDIILCALLLIATGVLIIYWVNKVINEKQEEVQAISAYYG